MSDDLLKPDYTPEQLVLVDKMRSRLNVARATLDARIAQGMTQDQLGRAAGTKQSRVSDLENMEGNPTLDTLDRVSRVLGLEVALVPRVGGPAPQESAQ